MDFSFVRLFWRVVGVKVSIAPLKQGLILRVSVTEVLSRLREGAAGRLGSFRRLAEIVPKTWGSFRRLGEGVPRGWGALDD
jgi:hypothetical protein